MDNLMNRYKFGIGCNEDICFYCREEFKSFILGFLIDLYPRLEIINWLEKDSEIIRVDVEHYYEPLLNINIGMKVTRLSDGSYYQFTMQSKDALGFDVSTAVNNMYCIVTKNENYA
jgi:hypothetical protein